MLKKVNIDVIDLGHAKDNISNIKSKFKRAINKSDIVISTGGVSVGDADYIKDVANSLGEVICLPRSEVRRFARSEVLLRELPRLRHLVLIRAGVAAVAGAWGG